MNKLTFFDAEELKKTEVDRAIDKIISMPKEKAVKIDGNRSKLVSLKQKIYMNHPGKFSISDKDNFLVIKHRA